MRLVLLGDPIEHSLSPRIHTAALEACGIEGSYEAIRADRDRLAEEVGRMRSGSLHGANVTMPLKRLAADMCDELSEVSRLNRSVNSLRPTDRRIEGHSTDSVAVESLLGSDRFDPGAAVLVLGAGATAEIAAHASGARPLYLSARRNDQAAALADGLARESAVVAFGAPVTGAIVINTTPLGMKGESLPHGVVETASGLIDLPYGDSATPAVATASELGIPVVDGVEFLVFQAASAFSWWTGREAPFDVMLSAARNS